MSIRCANEFPAATRMIVVLQNNFHTAKSAIRVPLLPSRQILNLELRWTQQ